MDPDAEDQSGAFPQGVASESDARPRGEIAHAAQLPPEGDGLTWLFLGGRGAGKTRAGAEWIADQVKRSPGGRVARIAPTEHDLRAVMIDGASGLLNLPNREPPRYPSTRPRLGWTNGAIARSFSAEEPERPRTAIRAGVG